MLSKKQTRTNCVEITREDKFYLIR
jgi:hypothetical protein